MCNVKPYSEIKIMVGIDREYFKSNMNEIKVKFMREVEKYVSKDP